MGLWLAVRERIRALFARGAEDRALEEELRFHVAMEAERMVRAGVEPADARRRAQVVFGGHDRTVEAVRDARGMVWLHDAWRDVRLGARSLRRDARFTVVTILALAAGVGATTAVFALANWLLIRPVVGVRAPGELVVVRLSAEPGFVTGVSHANIEDLRAGAPALSGLTGHLPQTLQAQVGGVAFEVSAAVVQGDYFGVLGIEPRLGRRFTASERVPRAAGDVVVISERFRSTHFGDATVAVGRTVRLNGSLYTVVGVAPAGFHGTDRTSTTDVWLPMEAYGRIRHRSVDVGDRGHGTFTELIGRLSPGASPALAQQQLRATMAALIEQYPEINADFEPNPPTVYPGIGVPVAVREQTTRTVRLLLAVVSVLLLIACANVANLLLIRGVSRQGEVAVRRALGASTGRLVRQQVTEGVLLSVLGGAAGVGVAIVLTRVLEGQSLLGLPPVEGLSVDWRVLSFAFGAALLTGLVFTLAPAHAAARTNVALETRATSRSSTGRGARLRGALTVVQLAASLALLVGALLLARTVRNIDGVDVGFDADAVHAFGYATSPQGYDADAAVVLRQRLLDDVAELRGIRSASIASFLPMPGDRPIYRITAPGIRDEPIMALGSEVSAEFFRTLGGRLLAGRAFTAAEQSSATAGVVITEAAARALFDAVDVVGRTVEVRSFTGATTQEVVIGVSEDLRFHPRAPVAPLVFLPIGAAPGSHGYVIVRSALPPAETRRAVAGALARLDPAIPFFSAESLGEAQRRASAEERLLARLLGIFAALAIALAAIGLYGVVAYSVARRRREIGIRIALGARAGQVVRLVATESLRLAATGGALGAFGGYALSRILASRLFGVAPLDPPTYLAAVLGLAAVAIMASVVPARAAASVDPVATLKEE